MSSSSVSNLPLNSSLGTTSSDSVDVSCSSSVAAEWLYLSWPSPLSELRPGLRREPLLSPYSACGHGATLVVVLRSVTYIWQRLQRLVSEPRPPVSLQHAPLSSVSRSCFCLTMSLTMCRYLHKLCHANPHLCTKGWMEFQDR